MVDKAKKGEVTTISGVPGLNIWGGVLGEEYLLSLKGTRKVKVFREMQDDAVIGTLLDAMLMPLLAAEFETVPADDTEKDKQNAEFLHQCMNDMTHYSWRQHVVDLMSMMVWGWAVSEIVAKKRSGTEAIPSSQYDDGKIGLHILDPRGQESLYRWEMDDEYNVLKMIQYDPTSGRMPEIEAWKMLHVTFRSRKRSPEGTSPMRSLYRSWYTRKNLEIIEAIGAERDLCGLPIIYLPYGASDEDKAAAETLIRNIRQDEEAGLVIPPPPNPDGEGAWKFELMASPGQKQFKVREIIRDLNKTILMRFFAQFLLLGMEKTGTQALVEGAHQFFGLCLKSIQQELLEAWNGQLVPFLFNMNPEMLSGAAGLPKIHWASPGAKDLETMVGIIEKLVRAQILTPEESIEDFMRKLMNLPDRPEGVGEGERIAAAPAPAAPVEEEEKEVQLQRQYTQPDPSDVHIPSAKRKKRRDHCMTCDNPPKVEVIWADGRAHAGFCLDCYLKWQIESGTHKIVDWCDIEGGVASERWQFMGDDGWLGYRETTIESTSFAEVAGIKGRRGTSKIGKATNEYQGFLTHLYDLWAKKAHRALLAASEGSRKQVIKVIDKQVQALEEAMVEAGKKHLEEAFRLGYKAVPDKEALRLLNKQIAQNSKYVEDSLIPRIRRKIVEHLNELEAQHQYQIDSVALLGLLQTMRSEPAGYAGAFWNTVFVARGFGRKREDQERIKNKQKPKRVKWVLDPAKEHCVGSAHGSGCMELAGVYSSWDAMPTVPAGQVTCLGNCGCHIEVENDSGGWS